MVPVTIPVLIVGLLTCVLLEQFGIFGYGFKLPAKVRAILEDNSRAMEAQMTLKHKAALIIQMAVAIFLILALAFHLAEVGVIGLCVIVLLTALNGITDEHKIGKSFEEALPFTALLVVFFAIVAVIHDQHLLPRSSTQCLNCQVKPSWPPIIWPMGFFP